MKELFASVALGLLSISTAEGMLVSSGSNLSQFSSNRLYGFLFHSFDPAKDLSDKEESSPKPKLPLSEAEKKRLEKERAWNRRAVWQ